MAGRFSVQGVFRVQDRMTAPIRRIQSRVERFQRAATSGLRGVREVATRLRFAFVAVAAAVATAAAAATAALRDVIETGMEFDATMTRAASRFARPLRRGSGEFTLMEEAALRTGAATEFTASQAAEALEALAMAGFNARQAIAALSGVTDLATNGNLELGDATSIATTTLNQWGLMTDDAAQLGRNLTRVNDVLARASTSVDTTIEQLTEGFRDAAPAARAAGVGLEQVTAMLDVLAEGGIRGAQSGTAFRAVLAGLTAPTAGARRALRRLRVELTDGHGNLRDVTEIMGDLQGAMGDMGTADRSRMLSTIFGRDASSAAAILVNGAQRARELQTSFENAQGASAEMAASMRDNAAGDVANLTSTLEGLKLQVWGLIRGPFRAVVQAVTEWFRANQEDIVGGLRAGIEWLTANMPEIITWARRIGIAIAVLAAPFVAFAAIATAAMLVIPAMIAGIIIGVQALWDWLSEIAQPILAAIMSVWQRVKGFFTAVLEFVVGLFVIISRAVMQRLQPVFAALRIAAGVFMAAWRPVSGFFAGIWDGIADAFSAAWDWIVDEAGWIYDWLVEIWEPIGDFFSGLWDGISDSFSSALGWVVDSISGLVGDVRAVGRGAMDGDEAARPGAARAGRQIVSPQERVGRAVSERRETIERSEVTIRDETGRAQVRRGRRGGGGEARARIRLQRSGAT